MSALQSRVSLWERGIDRYSNEWKDAEDAHYFYLKESDEDALRRDKRDTTGKPQFTTLVIPHSYAILLSLHTYWASVFLSRSPTYQFTARHGEPQTSVQAVESMIDYQVQVGGHLVPYYQWLLDVGKYGFGIIGDYWHTEILPQVQVIEEPAMFEGVIPLEGRTKKKRVTNFVEGYKGNKVFNVLPWDFIWDTRKPLAKFTEGEFAGRRVQDVSWNEIVRGEKDGRYFNLEALKRSVRGGDAERNEASQQMLFPNDEELFTGSADGPDKPHALQTYKLVELHVELIPKDWELGQSTYPEIWAFTYANDSVLIGAQPLQGIQTRFPFHIMTNEVDLYTLKSRSVYKILEPMQNLLDWLVNTHFYNVRKVLNDMFLYDPSRVVLQDVLRGGAGARIRVKPSMYGMDVSQAMKQLQVTDVTQNHMADAQRVMGLMQQIVGTSDNFLGNVSKGNRTSATEARQANSMSITRQKTQTEFMSAMGFSPLSQRLLQTSQQFYDQSFQVKLAGDQVGANRPLVQVAPETIAGFYDFVPVDGTMPIDRHAQAQLWTQMFAQLRNFPELMQGFDLAKVFAYVMQLAGIKNINQFKIEVMPDDQLATGVANGSLRPTGGAAGSGGAQSGGVGRASAPEAGVRDPARIAQLGPLS